MAGTRLGWEAARGPGQQAGQTEWLPDDQGSARAGDGVALAELVWPPSFSPLCAPAVCAAWVTAGTRVLLPGAPCVVREGALDRKGQMLLGPWGQQAREGLLGVEGQGQWKAEGQAQAAHSRGRTAVPRFANIVRAVLMGPLAVLLGQVLVPV